MSSLSLEKTIIQILEFKTTGQYAEAINLLESALQSYPTDLQLNVLLKRINLLNKIRA